MGVYSHYTMVTYDGKLVMGVHPEMMSAGLKAFSNMEELKTDISELYKIFPPGSRRVWIAVNEVGESYSPDTAISLSSDKAVKIYNKCDENLPNAHNYKPFLEYTNQTTPFHYKDWKSITQKYLSDNNIPTKLEKKSLKKLIKPSKCIKKKKTLKTLPIVLAHPIVLAQPLYTFSPNFVMAVPIVNHFF